MMALVDDLDLGLDNRRMQRAVPDRDATRAVFDRLEFSTLWTRLVELEEGVSEMSGTPIEVDVLVLQTPRTGGEDSAGLRGLVIEPVYDGGDLVGLVAIPDDRRPDRDGEGEDPDSPVGDDGNGGGGVLRSHRSPPTPGACPSRSGNADLGLRVQGTVSAA